MQNKSKTEPIYTAVNEFDGMKGLVFTRDSGDYAVRLQDSESGNILPFIKIIKDMERAKEVACELADIPYVKTNQIQTF